ncbi:MAG: hypothetical protein ABI539_15700 [Acidobacteriota bacterium]
MDEPIQEQEREPSFREFHKSFRPLRHRVWIDPRRNTGKPYRRPQVEGKPKGKLAQKAAKRQRVRELKAAQANG